MATGGGELNGRQFDANDSDVRRGIGDSRGQNAEAAADFNRASCSVEHRESR